jgi:SEC-C motif-containing protein
MSPDAIIMANNALCPCGTKKSYHKCCGIFHNGSQNPLSAEELMRSRYSAYALKNLTYIKNTMTGKAALGFSLPEAERHQNYGSWLGLDVMNSLNDKKNPDHAFVEFRALHNFKGTMSVLHELSEFTRIEGCWFYIDGETKKGSRNDLCPCQSGKKFKKCHGK